MADDNQGGTNEAKTYTQGDLDALRQQVEAVNAKNQELLAEKKKAQDRLKQWDGLDRSEVDRLLEMERQGKAAQQGINSEALNKIRAEIKADLEREYAPKVERLSAYERENRELKLDGRVKDVMGKNGVRSNRVDALFKLAGDRFDLTDDGKPFVKDRPGIPVDKYIAEELAKEYPELYESTGSSGGGAAKSTGSAGGGRAIAPDGKAFMSNLDGIAKGEVAVRIA